MQFSIDPDKICVAGFCALEEFIGGDHGQTPNADMRRLLAWFVCDDDGAPFEPIESPDGDLLPSRHALAKIGRLRESQLEAAFQALKAEFEAARQLPLAPPGSSS